MLIRTGFFSGIYSLILTHLFIDDPCFPVCNSWISFHNILRFWAFHLDFIAWQRKEGVVPSLWAWISPQAWYFTVDCSAHKPSFDPDPGGPCPWFSFSNKVKLKNKEMADLSYVIVISSVRIWNCVLRADSVFVHVKKKCTRFTDCYTGKLDEVSGCGSLFCFFSFSSYLADLIRSHSVVNHYWPPSLPRL